MNVENLYRAWFQINHPGGELIVINGKLMSKWMNSTSYQDITRDGNYNHIKSCIEKRNKSTSLLFACSCGVCSSYLLGKLYEDLLKRDDERIINEALHDAILETSARASSSTSSPAPSSTTIPVIESSSTYPLARGSSSASSSTTIPVIESSSTYPLDNMILTFGKHKDKSYKDIFRTDREYCLWCIETVAIERSKGSRINDNIVSFAGYVRHCLSKL